MRYYISGKMSGLSEAEYSKRFNAAEERLRAQGHKVFNPSRWGWLMKRLSYKHALGLDIFLMSFCDRVYMLRDWTLSDGATAEHSYARSVGMIVEYE